jgi:superfamily II DNA or RNA helicase
MTVALRPYQAEAEQGVYQIWQQHRNALAVLPTGAGKTVLFSKILHDFAGHSVAIAHRQELVAQISLALGRNGVRHRIIAPDSVRANIEALQMMELGRRWVDQHARTMVAGVDTLLRRAPPELQRVGLWVMDEAHHVLTENKWGKAVALMPNAYGLGVTATPGRADGKGLGRHADGVFDAMHVGPSMRDLINWKFLTEYRIFAPPTDLDLSAVATGAGGDYVQEQLRAAVHKSHVTGDVVKHYQRIAPGKLGVTFAVDIESATEICAAFRLAGVPAEVVTSKTPDALRVSILRRFKAREVLQLVNVDLFGEGFDLPAIEVVSMARPTQSYALFAQQFGRVLRLLEGKRHGLIVDHVGNCFRHGLPDAPREWSLDRRERRSSGASDAIPLRSCPGCTGVYERWLTQCPHCAYKPEPAGRSSPEQVEGDLHELDPAVLAALRGEVARIDGAPRIPQHLPPHAQRAVHNTHLERQQAQGRLREAIALWAGHQRHLGRSDAESYRRFFHTWGVDVLSAQALNAREAEALHERIAARLTADGIVSKMNAPTH